MDWDRDKSVMLSRCCVVLFALALLALDVCCWRLAQWFADYRFTQRQNGGLLMTSIYLGSVFGWVCLYRLWSLLANIKRGEVFAAANVKNMRAISWCCVWAALITALSALYYLPFIFIAVAEGFMALIVRIVKNAFEQAITMKDELDLTV